MALDPNRWTAKTQEAFRAAAERPGAATTRRSTPDHLLAAMLGQDDTVTLPILEQGRRGSAQPAQPARGGAGQAAPQLRRRRARLEPRLRDALDRADRSARPSATSTCRSSTCCWPWPICSGSAATTCSTPCATSGAATG